MMRELERDGWRVLFGEAGDGLSSYRGVALNRWAGDALANLQGFFIYLRDQDGGEPWSATCRLAAGEPARIEVQHSAERIVVRREHSGIESTLCITLPAAGLERRELRLVNRSGRPRRLELTSYLEVALAHRDTDLAHLAFSKLFVHTQAVGEEPVLLAGRRPRAPEERWPWLAHALAGAPVQSWQTDRMRFVGRGRDATHPVMAMDGTVGNVLDPCLSLRTEVILAPGESRGMAFLLAAAADRQSALALVAPLAQRGQKEFDAPAGRPVRGREPPVSPAPRPAIEVDFVEEGRAFRVRLPWTGQALALPPMPWINVLANERFGCLVSETGAGGTWSRNSQLRRLTPWSCDPVSDPHGEAFYLRDEDDGRFWSPLPGPAPAATVYETTHAFGHSRFVAHAHGLEQEATVFVAPHDPVKFVRLRLRNRDGPTRRLSLYACQHLVLGTAPQTPADLRTWRRGAVLCARSAAGGEFAEGIAFSLAVGEGIESQSLSCDRRAFIGELRSLRAPAALSWPALDGRCDSPLEPCFARQLRFSLEPDASAVFTIALGEAMGETELERLLARYADAAAVERAFADSQRFWNEALSGLRVRTPWAELDRLLNGWLPYQALASRLFGRTAFYQSSGALGFRDQLQDAGNLCLLWPQRTRAQLLLHARHQFEHGDVLHWWHPPPVARGLRTRCSDDLLWLPYVALQYLERTGDATLLEETVPFLDAPELAVGEEERYLRMAPGARASFYEHCARALDRALTRGAHGLPLIGTCDWNDGLNRVGRSGRGESVWLGFFLFDLLGRFAPLARRRGDAARAQRYAEYRAQLGRALEDAGWDGGWYRRAYYDDGTPLGTHTASECRIDSLAQSWAVLSGAACAERAAQALDAADAQLVDQTHRLIRLLTPPFEHAPQDPGYIKGYVAGVRENGGQYTHAACWLVEAHARLRRRHRAAFLLRLLTPGAHTRSAAEVERYQVEPYVIAADVYGAPPHVGRGGWTWYTGSAGLAWRVGVEAILGLRIEDGNTLVLDPCVPDDWPGYALEYRCPRSGTRYTIEVHNPQGCAERVVAATLDGVALTVAGGALRLPLATDGRTHALAVRLGSAPAAGASLEGATRSSRSSRSSCTTGTPRA
jgi:N,N'-diacetylchitobiose phosphorylase